MHPTLPISSFVLNNFIRDKEMRRTAGCKWEYSASMNRITFLSLHFLPEMNEKFDFLTKGNSQNGQLSHRS